jgi:hypothetical protein
MSCLRADIIAKHYNEAPLLFPDQELCSIITRGVSQKKLSDVTQADVRTGLRRANWAISLLQFMIDQPDQGAKILYRYLGRIIQIGITRRISVRLLASLVYNLEVSDFADKIPKAKDLIHLITDKQPKIVARIAKLKEQREIFDILFPADPYPAIHYFLLAKGAEISPKKFDKWIFEYRDTYIQQTILELYLSCLENHKDNSLAKKLVKYMKEHLTDSKFPYKDPLNQEIRKTCEKTIAAFEKACIQ